MSDTTELEAFPPLVAFMPHRAPMLLLDALVSHAEDEVVCEKTFREGELFVEEGGVNALVALELFAQAAAAHFGYAGLLAGGAARSGALLGARRIELARPRLPVGERLVVRARQVFAMPPAAQFECTLEANGERLAEGTINVAMGLEGPASEGAA